MNIFVTNGSISTNKFPMRFLLEICPKARDRERQAAVLRAAVMAMKGLKMLLKPTLIGLRRDIASHIVQLQPLICVDYENRRCT